MKKEKRSFRLKSTTCNREYHVLTLKTEYPPYWDEGIYFYPKGRRGFKQSNKQIMNYQRRMYRTWKHNRKTQWKE